MLSRLSRVLADMAGWAAACRRVGHMARAEGCSSAWLPAATPTVLEPWPDHNKPIEEASTLPAGWYTSPLLPPLEQRLVFGRSWQLVGHLGMAAQPGQYFTGTLAQWRYIVARGDDGQLRAFHNVCRHHAAAVATGCGHAEAWACPYHGWVYDVRGRLRQAPRVKGIRNFRAAEWGLRPIALDTWGPFVFLWLGDGVAGGDMGGGGPPSIQEWLGSGGSRMAELGLADNLVHVAHRSYTLNCNWKVVCDNFLDGGYHVPVAHPGLAGQLQLEGYSWELHPQLSLQTCAPGKGAGSRVSSERPAAYFFQFPNIMVNRYGPWMDTNVVLPAPAPAGAPAMYRCVVRFDWWLERGELERRLAERGAAAAALPCSGGGNASGGVLAAALEGTEFTHPDAAGLPYVLESLAASHQVQVEDIELCEAVQAGLEEPSYSVGRYAPLLEGPMFHFHRLLHAAVAAGDGFGWATSGGSPGGHGGGCGSSSTSDGRGGAAQ